MKKSLENQIKAILFDLDGTLLEINLNLFIRDYLKGLSASIAHIIPQKKLIPHLMKVSKIMENNDGKETNEILFKKSFFPLIGYSQEEIEPLFMNYYEQGFSKLKHHAKKKPEARPLMSYLFDKGYDVVIATTPLLPKTAIEQRLEWAEVDDFPYKLITSYEIMKATKPNLLYFKQILEIIGRPPEACLMVGDENKDMVAAHLGIQTFLITSPETKLNPSTPEPSYRGTLAEVMALI
ncbi:MAG: HAD family hydrolase [Promethearchaeota archaeon]|nr:MAG: HAD family hydrolase [Candidatus Lokiarchaeota archaeon]